jgi:hypothetical protein
MIFTLEALQAKHGDALLLHYGDAASTKLIVIDGGPSGVYNHVMKPRLDELKASKGPNRQLEIRLLMVSHIDDDHIRGILDLTDYLVETQDAHGTQIPYNITTLWHNSFDDIIGNEPDKLFTMFEASVQPLAIGEDLPAALPLNYDGALMVASVKQGRTLRQNADNKLHLNINSPFGKFVMAPKGEVKKVDLGNELKFTILGPSQLRIEDLQKEWDRKLEELKLAEKEDAQAMAAAFIDNSVYNLASIIVMARIDDKKMLLTGDARGDDIIKGLKEAQLMENNKCHVDLLKIPHHGSDRNVSREFFETVTADYYVISADGKHNNPELTTLKMISEARGQADFTIYLTNKEQRLVDFFNSEKAAGKNYDVVFRKDNELSIKINLGDAFNL